MFGPGDDINPENADYESTPSSHYTYKLKYAFGGTRIDVFVTP